MNKIILTVIVLIITVTSSAQHTLLIKVRADNGESLPGATVILTDLKKTVSADSSGTAVFTNIGRGKLAITISHIGFAALNDSVSIKNDQTSFVFYLKYEEEEEEEVIIQSTRTSRNIKNVPTRIETITLEEIDEKSNMRPSNVSMILHESTGIQVQQTSATNGNASIRIQGLDGRYTQLLKDGFASFNNLASGLSVLEIPPLDLKQVEIIKGPASTLNGGGAVAGVINFISKTPGHSAENNLLFNQSNVGQTNVGFYSSKKNKRTGYTFLGSINNQKLYDVDKDDFTELPKSFDFTIHPKLFLYPNDKTVFIIGNSFTKGNRKGGDVQVIKGKKDAQHQYFEENNTIRNITTLELQKKIGEKKGVTVKQSFSLFDRHIQIPAYHFDGISYNSFTDISFLTQFSNHSLVTGGNIVYDKFNENDNSATNRDNTNFTFGAFIQDTWDVSEKIKLESGLRIDHSGYSNTLFSNNEFFVLPRISLLVKYNNKLSSRIGGGLGYKLPTLFTEQTETIQYKDVRQLNHVKSERSYGATADLNYKTRVGEGFDFSFNHMFFYSWIDKPLILQGNGSPDYFFANASRPVISKGFETNAKFIYKNNFKLFLGYTFTDTRAKYLTGYTFLPLVPKHRFNSALIYEKHKFLKVGLEGYYTGHQHLNNGAKTSDFWEFGFMAEKLWKRFSLYINFENFTDTRQSRYKRVVNGPPSNPTFDDIWTHTEGFIINGGVKIKL